MLRLRTSTGPTLAMPDVFVAGRPAISCTFPAEVSMDAIKPSPPSVAVKSAFGDQTGVCSPDMLAPTWLGFKRYQPVVPSAKNTALSEEPETWRAKITFNGLTDSSNKSPIGKPISTEPEFGLMFKHWWSDVYTHTDEPSTPTPLYERTP